MDAQNYEAPTIGELIQASLVCIWVLLCLFRDARFGEEWRNQDEGYEAEDNEEDDSKYEGSEDEEFEEDSEKESGYDSEDDDEEVQERVSQSEGSGGWSFGEESSGEESSGEESSEEESSWKESSKEEGYEDDETEPVPSFPSPELQEALLAEAARVEEWERRLRWQKGYIFSRAQPCPCGSSSCQRREGAQPTATPRPADYLWPGFHRDGDHWKHRGTWVG